MTMNLVIVESGNKIDTLEKYAKALGRPDLVFAASGGHIRDLPKKELGVAVDNGFAPSYVISEGKTGKVTELRNLARKASSVILATDDDREGEAIAWHLMKVLNLPSNTPRIKLHEITKSELAKALASPQHVDMNMVAAQESRRVLDRLVGYQASSALSQAYGVRLIVGRVQSPALRLLVERELRIRNHEPIKHFSVDLDMDGWHAKWHFAPLLPPHAESKVWTDKAMAVLASQAKELTLKQASVSNKNVSPPDPFITSTIQQAASNALALTPKLTMAALQTLFEQGLITYPRTDSPVIAAEFTSIIRDFLVASGQKCSPQPRVFKAGKGAQEAHECIRPTDITLSNDIEKHPKLDEACIVLYKLIWARTVASQMIDGVDKVSDAVFEGMIQGRVLEFKARSRSKVVTGWRAVDSQFESADTVQEADESDVESSHDLPASVTNAAPGTRFPVLSSAVKEGITKPPRPYNEASLVRALEAFGVGRPATYAAIIDSLVRHKNAAKSQKTLIRATDQGIVLIMAVDGIFSFTELKYTSGVEKALDGVAQGQSTFKSVVNELYQVLSAQMHQIQNKPNNLIFPPPPELIDKVKRMEERSGLTPPLGYLDSATVCAQWLQSLAGNVYPPTKAAFDYAQKIADKLVIPLPPECSTDGTKCTEFINDHKKAFSALQAEELAAKAPSAAMVEFAEKLAEDKGLELPPDYKLSYTVCQAFLDKNSKKRRKKKAA